MKKFLSLVLALVMTMSLVTISAGATEYKDLTDKDEIQYEEAVAVLNRIGIITGYDDGTFRPETELTRGAAAKIIVSLMIGPEAANALPNTYSPYPDVPAGHTFAGVISYCKTAGYISGYGDGTFKPANSLTGFAFAKMLLGALGYKSDLEGFTGTGWTMNVAKLGNAAGLFNRLSFNGAEAVNREEACQLALNTLKATMVEYTGGFNIVSGDATIVGNQVRTYITSNQDYAAHINNKKVTDAGNANVNNHYTVEFGEEHFKDLRMRRERTTLDDFGRPSNEWSYKKVTIGTFPVEPDFVYTTQVTAVNDVKVTKATKIRDLELNGYEVDGGTLLKVNGKTESVFTDDNNIEKIADYTDNGTVVEVYVSEDHADYVENVVVVKTQLMEVKKLGSDYVALDKEDDCDDNEKTGGFNQPAIEAKVDDVEVNDVCYDFLKGLKAGDKVAVIPVTVDEGDSYTVARAYTPETVTGSLDGSRSFANTSVTDPKRSVIEVTVGGTAYKVATWNKDLQDANRDVIKVTNKDVTLLLDEFGNALLAKDIGSTAEYMILGAWRNSVVNGVLVRLATGWDVKGTEISLNVGSEQSNAVDGYKAYKPGDVLRYTNDGVTGTAEWKLSKAGVYLTPGNVKVTDLDSFAIKASNSAVTLMDYKGVDKNETLEVASGIKTIYVTFDTDGEVDYIEIKDGLQNISQRELKHQGRTFPTWNQAEATISKLSGNAPTDKSEVTFVVVKDESNDATLKNLGFVYKNDNTTNNRDENGDILTKYNVFTVDDENVSMTANKSITNYHFVRFKLLDEAAGRYDLKDYDVRQRTTSVAKVTAQQVVSPNSNNLIRLKDEYRNMAGGLLPLTNDPMPNINTNKQGWGTDAAGTDLTEGDKYKDLINVKGAKFLDLVNSSSVKIDDADDLKEALKEYDVEMSIAFNDNPDNDEFRKAYIVVITGLDEKDTTTPVEPTTGNVKLASGEKDASGNPMLVDLTKNSKLTTWASGQMVVDLKFQGPDWATAYRGSAGVNEGTADLTFDAVLIHDGSDYLTKSFSATAGGGSGDIKYTVATSTKNTRDFNATYTFNLSGTPLATSAMDGKWTVEIRNVKWANAATKLEAANGTTTKLSAAGVALAMGSISTDSTAKTSAGSFLTYTLDTTNFAEKNGTYAISGVTLDKDETVTASGKLAALTFSKDVYAHNGWVTVTIGGITEKAATKYTIKNDDMDTGSKFLLNPSADTALAMGSGGLKLVAAADATTLQVNVYDGSNEVLNASTGVFDGTTAGQVDVSVDKDTGKANPMTLKVQVGAIGANGSPAYDIEIKITDENGDEVSTFKQRVAAGKEVEWPGMKGYEMSKNLFIKKSDVKVTPVQAVTIDFDNSTFVPSEGNAKVGVLTLKFTGDGIMNQEDLGAFFKGEAAVAANNATVSAVKRVDANTVTMTLVYDGTTAVDGTALAKAKLSVKNLLDANGYAIADDDVFVTIAIVEATPAGNAIGDVKDS